MDASHGARFALSDDIRTRLDRWLASYTNQAIGQIHRSAELNTLMMEVAHMVRSPVALFQPQVVWRVLTSR
ncbi:MAG: hypothetical protein MUF49_23915 [Oculatellaceae cyanobacterium Prado106]|jgi:hypothetical protein|nr:hypothetical protein [Oculatellaceae cyanobacterium Prado106]